MRYNMLVILALSLLFGCQSAAEWGISKRGLDGIEKIAVLTVISPDVPSVVITVPNQDVRALAEKSLLEKGYIVVDRSKLTQTMGELKMQHDDLFSVEGRKQLGNLMGIDAFLYIAINEKDLRGGGTVMDNITGQIVSVNDSTVLATALFDPPKLSLGVSNHGVPELMANFPKYNP